MDTKRFVPNSALWLPYKSRWSPQFLAVLTSTDTSESCFAVQSVHFPREPTASSVLIDPPDVRPETTIPVRVTTPLVRFGVCLFCCGCDDGSVAFCRTAPSKSSQGQRIESVSRSPARPGGSPVVAVSGTDGANLLVAFSDGSVHVLDATAGVFTPVSLFHFLVVSVVVVVVVVVVAFIVIYFFSALFLFPPSTEAWRNEALPLCLCDIDGDLFLVGTSAGFVVLSRKTEASSPVLFSVSALGPVTAAARLPGVPGHVAIGDSRGSLFLCDVHAGSIIARSEHAHRAPVVTVIPVRVPEANILALLSLSLDGEFREMFPFAPCPDQDEERSSLFVPPRRAQARSLDADMSLGAAIVVVDGTEIAVVAVSL